MTSPETPQPNVRRWYSRGYLPHYDVPEIAQFITFRQDDSVPARLLRAYANALNRVNSASERTRTQDRVLTHLEKFLGKGRGSCRLRDPRAARVVEDALFFYAPKDYQLIAWVVMPNHVHVVIRPTGTKSLELITQRWKSWTARQIHQLFGTSGRFWLPEVFDRWLRTPDERTNAIRYVELNPVRAKLCGDPLDWEFSSARRYPQRWGIGVDWER